MLTMEQVKDIKYLRERKGLSYREIVKETGHAFETVKKYADQDDFNIQPKARKERKSKLEPYQDIIKSWLGQDLQASRKQRHTAQRIYIRLKEMFGDKFDVSDRAVRTWVAKLRKEMNNKNDGYLPLEHPPGEAQADFGEAVFVENGKRYQGHYLTLSFPYSNGGAIPSYVRERTRNVCLPV
jgi:transposase